MSPFTHEESRMYTQHMFDANRQWRLGKAPLPDNGRLLSRMRHIANAMHASHSSHTSRFIKEVAKGVAPASSISTKNANKMPKELKKSKKLLDFLVACVFAPRYWNQIKPG